MVKQSIWIFLYASFFICLIGCGNDDDTPNAPPQLTVAERLERDEDSITKFFSEYYYVIDSTTVNSNIVKSLVFKKINSEEDKSKPSLASELGKKLRKRTTNFFSTPVDYYVFTEFEGGNTNTAASNVDYVLTNYTGKFIYDNLSFDDRSDFPGNLDLTTTITGFSLGLEGFSGTMGEPVVGDNGFLQYNSDGGLGAVFMPNAIAYNGAAPGNIPLVANRLAFEPIYFSFNVLKVEVADHDGDGIPSKDEDGVPNGTEDGANDGNPRNDDTDGDGLFNYLDTDDDNDGKPTNEEIEVDATTGQITYPDSDSDKIPDYLDRDN